MASTAVVGSRWDCGHGKGWRGEVVSPKRIDTDDPRRRTINPQQRILHAWLGTLNSLGFAPKQLAGIGLAKATETL